MTMFNKCFVLVLMLGCFLNSEAQTIKEFFEFGEGRKIPYSRILGGKRSVVKFYVIFTESPEYAKAVKECKQKWDYKVFFTLTIPEDLDTWQEREELFLAFASWVIGTTKVIDSHMYVISDRDYTGLYEKTRQENDGYYNYRVLNKIEGMFLGKSPREVCEIIGQ